MEGVTRATVGVNEVSADEREDNAATANASEQESDMGSDKVSTEEHLSCMPFIVVHVYGRIQ